MQYPGGKLPAAKQMPGTFACDHESAPPEKRTKNCVEMLSNQSAEFQGIVSQWVPCCTLGLTTFSSNGCRASLKCHLDRQATYEDEIHSLKHDYQTYYAFKSKLMMKLKGNYQLQSLKTI